MQEVSSERTSQQLQASILFVASKTSLFHRSSILYIINRILAKEIANTRKAVDRMYTAKAVINSVSNSLQTSISVLKMQVKILLYLHYNVISLCYFLHERVHLRKAVKSYTE